MLPKPNQDGRCGDDVHGALHDALLGGSWVVIRVPLRGSIGIL